MAIVTRTTELFTDPEGLPVLLHGTGVDGASQRWLAADAGVAVGAPFQTLDSHPSGAILNNTGASSTWPILRDISGVKVAELDYSALPGDSLGILGGALTSYRTVAMVVRRHSINGFNNSFIAGGTSVPYSLGATSANALGITWAGGGSTIGAAWSDTLWHFLAWSGSATDQYVVFDGNTYTSANDVASACAHLWVGYAGFSTVYGMFQTAEIITWPTALTTGQLATVRQAMKDRYSTALAL